jgi:hypothetical protein
MLSGVKVAKTLMTEAPAPLSPDEEAELDRLCEEYAAAMAAVRKNMRFGNPPDPGRVLMFVELEASAAAVLGKIKQILGVAASPR